jgi:hypothetical protein
MSQQGNCKTLKTHKDARNWSHSTAHSFKKIGNKGKQKYQALIKVVKRKTAPMEIIYYLFTCVSEYKCIFKANRLGNLPGSMWFKTI